MTGEELQALRPLAFSIAYRMVGGVSDAEDLAQEALIRLDGAEGVESPEAFLSSVVTRLSIDHLRSARVRRETYVGPWLPEPLLTDPEPGPAEHAEMADSLSQAFLVLLEALTPTERAALLLHDVFGHDYAAIAGMLERSEASCRQLVSRARRRVDDERPRFEADAAKRDELAERFAEAVSEGDLEGLTSMLAADALFVSDGGGKVTAAGKPLFGAERVASVLIGFRRAAARQRIEIAARPARVNGHPGFLIWENDALTSVYSIEIADGQIQALRVMRNPDKLRHVFAQL